MTGGIGWTCLHWHAYASVLLLLVLAVGQNQTGEEGYVPKGGFVPDEKTAKVAEAVLIPIYGQAKIESEHAFHAVLKDDVWTVKTSAAYKAVGQL
jgi:hypothetical protein